MLDQPVRIVFETWDHLTAVEAGGALADVSSLKDLHGQPGPGGVKGGRQAEYASAYNQQIELALVSDLRSE